MNDTIKDLADFAKMTSQVLRESGDSTLKAIADALDLSQVEIKRLVAINAELVEALEVLADEANSFNVSGVYFNEKCMGHKGLDMADAALEKAKQ